MTTTTQKTPLSRVKRRSFLVNSALTLGAFSGANTLLAACGSNAGTSGGTSTISVMFDPNDLSTAAINGFMQLNPTIKVKFLPYDAVKLASSLAAGSPPDVVE